MPASVNACCTIRMAISQYLFISALPQNAHNLRQTPASQAFTECPFSVCGILTVGRCNRMDKNSQIKSQLKASLLTCCRMAWHVHKSVLHSIYDNALYGPSWCWISKKKKSK